MKRPLHQQPTPVVPPIPWRQLITNDNFAQRFYRSSLEGRAIHQELNARAPSWRILLKTHGSFALGLEDTLRASLKARERNDFALLEQIGAECAGAVSLQQAGEVPPLGIANYRRIELSELEEKLRGLPKTPLLAGEDGIRLSLAGAQGKAAVALRDGSYLLPLDGSGEH